MLVPALAAREHTGYRFHPDNLQTKGTEPPGDRALPAAQFRYPPGEERSSSPGPSARSASAARRRMGPTWAR